jgi:hypothetical protein
MCGDKVCSGLVQIISAAATNAEGDLIPDSEAAPRVDSVLRSLRRTPSGEPLGVLVSFDVELLGLRDEEILVRWSIWNESGPRRLFGDWLSSNVAYRLTASSEDDATSLDIWVPLPKGEGTYFVRLVLTADGTRLARRDTEPFR